VTKKVAPLAKSTTSNNEKSNKIEQSVSTDTGQSHEKYTASETEEDIFGGDIMDLCFLGRCPLGFDHPNQGCVCYER
jgi:hypothetical protein